MAERRAESSDAPFRVFKEKIIMGSTFKKIASIALAFPTGGASLAWGSSNKAPEVKEVPIATQVAEDKKKNANKRKALYATQGGVLGQEVNQVGGENRGNLFGN